MSLNHILRYSECQHLKLKNNSPKIEIVFSCLKQKKNKKKNCLRKLCINTCVVPEIEKKRGQKCIKQKA